MAAPVPWADIVQLAISLGGVAKDVYNKWSAKPKPPAIDPHSEVRSQIALVVQRLETLEANENEQVRVIQQMAEQVNRLSLAVERLHKRNIAAFVTAGAALVASGAALAAVVLR